MSWGLCTPVFHGNDSFWWIILSPSMIQDGISIDIWKSRILRDRMHDEDSSNLRDIHKNGCNVMRELKYHNPGIDKSLPPMSVQYIEETCTPFVLCLFKCGQIQIYPYSGPLFTKRTDALLQDLVKSAGKPRVSGSDVSIALKFDRHIGSSAAEMPVKFQSDMIIITSNLVASRLHEIWRIWQRTGTWITSISKHTNDIIRVKQCRA